MHSTQNKADFYKNQKNPKTGKSENSSKDVEKRKKNVKSDDERKFEQAAHKKRDAAEAELAKKYKLKTQN